MIQVAPSLLAADFGHLADDVAMVQSADIIHVDVMDGQFVPNITMGPMVVKAIREATDLPLDVHMMVMDPDRFLSLFREAGADMISVHVEACLHLERTITEIHRLGALAGAAINPATPVEAVRDVLSELDYVLVMSVNPGFGGQKFWPQAAHKVKQVVAMRGENHRPLIEVDGGIERETGQTMKDAGADILVAGSFVFGGDDPAERIQILREG